MMKKNAGGKRSLLKGAGGDDLSAIKDLIASIHLSSCHVIDSLTGRSQYPAFTSNFLQELSRAPEWVEEVKRSACRKGVIQALTLCKI